MNARAGSYQQVTAADAGSEAARLQAQLGALWARERAALEQAGLAKGAGRLLEVGCGNGAVLSQVRRELAPQQAFGVDLELEHLKRAHAVAPVSRANGAALPFRDGSFDVVFFRYVLRHVQRPLELLREAARVLKPGGKVVALDSDDGGLMFDPLPEAWPSLSKALDESVRRRGANPHMGRTLYRLLVEAGFDEVTAAAQTVSSSQLPAPAFIELILAPNARPIDQDLLAPAEAAQAWASMREWARRPDAFCCALGVSAGGRKR